jgi:pimeloyl-ACP methyl ester carboxylesterase
MAISGTPMASNRISVNYLGHFAPTAPRRGRLADLALGGLRMAYVEAGPADGEPVLLLHGEPSWSFLYRKIIPVLADAGLRAIAPDMIVFGRSDKPAEIGDHSYARHVEWTRAFALDVLGLRGCRLGTIRCPTCGCGSARSATTRPSPDRS